MNPAIEKEKVQQGAISNGPSDYAQGVGRLVDVVAQLPGAYGLFVKENSRLGGFVFGNDRFTTHLESADLTALPQRLTALGLAPDKPILLEVGNRWLEVAMQSISGEKCDLWLIDLCDAESQMGTFLARQANSEQLMETSRMMSIEEVTATLAHELNQPLASISNALTFVEKMEPGLGKTSMEAIAMAKQQAEHSAAFVKRMRDYAHARKPAIAPTDVNEMIDAVVDLMRAEATPHRVEIATHLNEALPQVGVDRVMIEQVLINLVRNAKDALLESGARERHISVTTALNIEAQVEIRISDSGDGVAEEHQARIFQPFFSTKDNGLGIGLAICRSIVEYHSGRLYYDPADQSFIVALEALEASTGV